MNRPGVPATWGENGHEPSATSAPQGRAPSDPDGDGNGGLDKPGEIGGFNNDRDGNNGCGNDLDREDDNNGWCGPRRSAEPADTPPVTERPPQVRPSRAPRTVVMSGKVTDLALARTGVDVQHVSIAGWGFVLAGIGVRRRTTRNRSTGRVRMRGPFLTFGRFRYRREP